MTNEWSEASGSLKTGDKLLLKFWKSGDFLIRKSSLLAILDSEEA